MGGANALPLLQIVFTLDYEIFGDGTGSVRREQCLPTEYLAQVLEHYGGKLTIFAETGQQIYFNANSMTEPAEMVEVQLRDLYSRGHDVQLHIHPMWFFAPAPRNGKIELDSSKFDLSTLDPVDMERIIADSVAYLKSVIGPVQPNYAPVAFRAGAWSMRNTDALFETLARHGIRIDSTIAPGARLAEGTYGQFDYAGFEMKASWQYGPMTELPILTEKGYGSVFYYSNSLGIRTRRLVTERYQRRLTARKKSKLQKLRDVILRDYCMADFNFLSAKCLARMIRRHAVRHAACDTLPVVLIGHSKSTYFVDRLHELFSELDMFELRYEFVRLSDFVSGICTSRKEALPMILKSADNRSMHLPGT